MYSYSPNAACCLFLVNKTWSPATHVHLLIFWGCFVHNSRTKWQSWRLCGLQNLKYVLYGPLQVKSAKPGSYEEGTQKSNTRRKDLIINGLLNVANTYIKTMAFCCCCCFKGEEGCPKTNAFNFWDFIQTFSYFSCHLDGKVHLRSHLWPFLCHQQIPCERQVGSHGTELWYSLQFSCIKETVLMPNSGGQIILGEHWWRWGMRCRRRNNGARREMFLKSWAVQQTRASVCLWLATFTAL